MTTDDLLLPRWAYVPSRDAGADRETLERVKALVPPRFADCVPADHPALIYGLALNDAGFFWECHEILEAVWKAAPQGGRDRILLRACIQIANANLKSAMGRSKAVHRLLAEALAELDELALRDVGRSDGFADSCSGGPLAAALRGRLRHHPGKAAPIKFGPGRDDMQQNASLAII